MTDQNNPQDTPKKLSKAESKRRQIKEVRTKLSNLSPVVAAEVVEGAVAARARQQFGGFADFIREQGVVGVGVGLVLGIQVKSVVDTIMASFVNPVTELLLPGKGALSAQTFALSFGSKTVKVGWGAIVYSLFTFLMVALIIYAAYKLLRLDRLKKSK
jgi:large conductance mechanosensitive channel